MVWLRHRLIKLTKNRRKQHVASDESSLNEALLLRVEIVEALNCNEYDVTIELLPTITPSPH